MSDNSSSPLEEFDKEKIIIVEGKDDKFFFQKLLEKIEIDDIQVLDINGKIGIDIKLDLIRKIPGYNNIKKIIICIDADDNYENSKKSIESQISNFLSNKDNQTKMGKNPKIDYYILPNNNDNGMMETLCINSRLSSPEMEDVNKFIEIVKNDGRIKNKPKIEDKAKAQAFLSIMPEIVYGMSFGIVKNYWDLNHGDFKKIIDFLKSI